MKPTIQTIINRFLLISILFFAFQSCNIYHSPSYSIDKAIEKEKKVQITKKDYHKYKFDRITKENDELIGQAKLKSETAKQLQEDIISIDSTSKSANIRINPDDIIEFKVKNGAASTGSKVGIGLIIAGVLGVTALILSFALGG